MHGLQWHLLSKKSTAMFALHSIAFRQLAED